MKMLLENKFANTCE